MKEIVKKQLAKVRNHYQALGEYKRYIDGMEFDFSVAGFEKLSIEQTIMSPEKNTNLDMI